MAVFRLWVEVTNEVYQTELSAWIERRETEEMMEKQELVNVIINSSVHVYKLIS